MRSTFAASSGMSWRWRRADRNRGEVACNTSEREERTDKAPPGDLLVDDDGDNDGGIGFSEGDVGRGGRGRGSDEESRGASSVDGVSDDDEDDNDDTADACNSSSCRSIRALPYEWNRVTICSTELTTSSSPLPTKLLPTPPLPPLAAALVTGEGALAPRTADISWPAGRGNTSGVNCGWIQWRYPTRDGARRRRDKG